MVTMTATQLLLVVLCISLLFLNVVAGSASIPYIPEDNYLIDCGSSATSNLDDGRTFNSDQKSAPYLSTKKEIQISAPFPNANVPSPIYLTARIFEEESTYAFQLTRPGWHWIRLHFFPINNSDFDLTRSIFSVETDEVVLLHSFSATNTTKWIMKEYLLNITTENLSIKFSPLRKSFAFINALEVVSAPDSLIPDVCSSLVPIGYFSGLSTYSYQTMYRLNMGGSLITPQNDTLGRVWEPDLKFLKIRGLANTISVSPSTVTYPDGLSPLIAPSLVYATATEMAHVRVINPNFNVTWNFNIDPAFSYLLRLHFCDIISKSLNDLYFNVYINGQKAISGLDLSSITSGLAISYYKDIIVNSSMLLSDKLKIQIGPVNQNTGSVNAILNGLEVLKMSNSLESLDGEFGVNGSQEASSTMNRGTVAAVGFAMMFGVFVGLGAMVIKWRKMPQNWDSKNHSFSSWLLPLHGGNSTFVTNSKTSIGSNKGGNGNGNGNFYSSSQGFGRYFSFAELKDATKNFDQKAVIGVGGFGNVYLGNLDDGTQVAVKRGNPQSEQGIDEFQTEIQMLSKLRHRHLVSLIGYCDENSEMILVYEYMSNGSLREHLYGTNLSPLSWKQRLEICIGAARGLHYLHTGAAQGIIHRDVKSTNILLDENLIAKMSDFGLSKTAPTMGLTHVSTAVKGSFGYLDPEYFRRQQLNDKSDVYSFGVVLLEVLCARPAINPALPREQVNLAEWGMQWKRKGLLDKIIDTHLVGVINPESMKKFAEATEKCLAEYGVDRPTMGDVLWNLEYALQLQEASCQGKMEEEKRRMEAATIGSAVVVPTANANANANEDNHMVVSSGLEGDGETAQVIHAIEEHSGTAMFAKQIMDIKGR
ncbi:probable receptor-like protein kinase At4g39110 [Macadamia integrifolia]|uniref:probable receptor-like protein kinase At4g39110 n=1 Tax=Macadamia integrifolia TaxID=60698 RepID=UPI001C4EBDDE|nr:probable receptor-like protein kinase At4g39110 [Macadamia integrifolia]